MSFKAEGNQAQICGSMADILNRIGDKWSVMIVGHLTRKTMRFNELRHSIGGISQRMLTLTLRNLERDGLVIRTVYPEIPPRVEYQLTELGRTLTARSIPSGTGQPSTAPTSALRARLTTACTQKQRHPNPSAVTPERRTDRFGSGHPPKPAD